MGFLSDIQHDDARFGLFNSDEHAESVTIIKADASTYTVNAIVNRDVYPDADEQANGQKEIMLVEVENHATRGISSSAFDAGTWKITVAYRIGETARTYILGMPVAIDAQSIRFRIK
jgi:hypothetical protein